MPDSQQNEGLISKDSLVALFYERFIQPRLFEWSKEDPEKAHELVISTLAFISSHKILINILDKFFGTSDISTPIEVFGLTFSNPIGLAAGFDKNGIAINALARIFGFIECGTVTYHSQQGNKKPRITRLPEDDALINSMGFNNNGAYALSRRLSQSNVKVPIGVSIGKSRSTNIDDAIEDYKASFAVLYPFADYFVLNISFPNTPGLRNLQESLRLRNLISEIKKHISFLSNGRKPKPLLIKLSPDMSDVDLCDVLHICLDLGVDGIIAVNTSLSRDGLVTNDTQLINKEGGLSGRPLHMRAIEVIEKIHEYTGGRVPIIGGGGIFDHNDVKRMFDSGASLVQIYTGFIYKGPTLPRRILQEFIKAER